MARRKPSPAPAAGSTYNRAARRAWRKQKKAIASSDNPENVPEARDNPLFGDRKRQREEGSEPSEKKAKPQKKKPRPEVMKQDPAAALARQSKAAAKTRRLATGATKKAGGRDTKRGKLAAGSKAAGEKAGASTPKNTRRHGDEVDVALKAWERLRQERTPPEERTRLIDEVLETFEGKIVQVLQKHDAARVLQTCYRLGTEVQREELMRGLGTSVVAVALSHYGHFFLLAILRHGPPAHRQILLSQLTGHVRELVVHAEGSAVLQLAYSSVATPAQRANLYRELWGKEYALLGSGKGHTTLASLFEAEPTAKARVMRQLEILLSKAAQKGLAMTTIVQRGLADLLDFGEDAQRVLLASTLSGAAAHIMHERDGARIACACLRYGSPKDRKGLLKSLKGYVGATATHANGTLVLCAALETVDDTVLLKKTLLSEMIDQLASLASHPHGSLPLLAVLAPRAPRYFSPEQLQVLGADAAAGSSKKEPAVRRGELLGTLLPPLLRLVEASSVQLARSPHGGGVVYETLAAGVERDAAAASPALSALAAAATVEADGEDDADEDAQWAHLPLILHPYGGRLLKRLVQGVTGFAEALLSKLLGSLSTWATRGGGWTVLALLEHGKTGEAVKKELTGSSAKAIAKSGAPGCRSLAAALGVLAHGSANTSVPTPTAATKKRTLASGVSKPASSAKAAKSPSVTPPAGAKSIGGKKARKHVEV